MASTRFWVLFCLLIVLAIPLFGAPVFARSHKPRPKPARPIVKMKPVVKIGKPYISELPKK